MPQKSKTQNTDRWYKRYLKNVGKLNRGKEKQPVQPKPRRIFIKTRTKPEV